MPTTTGVATSFIDFTRASNATVTDSDGKVKWAPHNLLTNSESFDAAAWSKTSVTPTANSIAAPNGTTTADTLAASGANGTTLQTFTAEAISYTFSVWLRRKTGTGTIEIAADSGTYTAVTITSSWALYTVTQTPAAGSKSAGIRIVTSGDEVYAWGAALYRSDLAMQPNTSAYPMYNPTTPKNLLGYTEDFSNAAWAKTAGGSGSVPVVTPNVGVAPNGLTSADRIVLNRGAGTASGDYSLVRQIVNATGSGAKTYSIYVKSNDGNTYNVCFKYLLATSTVSVGASWTRIEIEDTQNNFECDIVLGGVAGAGTTSQTADILVWGAQLSDSASLDSYVPVYGAAVTSAAYYGPRRDFDPVTLACKGLLVEEQRANLLLHSAAFDNAAWSKGRTVVSSDTAVAPDGTSSADTLETASGTSAGEQYIRVNATTTSTSTFSVYVKKGNWRYVGVRLFNYSIFDFDTETWTLTGAGETVSKLNVGNGWYRLSTTSSSTGGAVPSVSLHESGTTIIWNTPINGTNVYLWGAQFEAGSFATSYIPVGATTAGATRNADVASVSTQAFPYSATEGSIVVSATPMALGSIAYALSDGTASNRIQAQMQASNFHFYIDAGGVAQVNLSPGTLTANTTAKLAGAYKANDFAASDNGSAVATDTNGSVPVCSKLDLGHLNSSNYLNGHIRQITYLPRRVSNAELVTRST